MPALSGDPKDDANGRPHQERVKQFIESTLASVLDELSKPDGRPSVTLKRRSKRANNCSLNEETGALQVDTNGREWSVTYSWPGKTVTDAWKFGVIMRILGHISEAIEGKFISSKRDIYYLDPAYFGSQRLVDGYIDDIAYTVGVDRAALHVGILIPRAHEIVGFDLSGVRWILIIEKEAVFHRLATSNYHATSAAGGGILITGKGYPDLSTRAFLRSISEWRNSPARFIPIYVLVDCDPDGMAIMSTYKYGSISQSHENANLNVPGVEWLGLRASDTAIPGNADVDRPLIPMTLRDRTRAQAMLSHSVIFSDEREQEWRLELQRMLMVNAKAEIEVLYEKAGGIEGWLDRKLKR
ncbi:meiosis-specific topoisomerase Spo11 [Coccidioides immitis RMSCC 2394]|uniref:DNA topoisomerase (ATP-hydrolyzing) n=1 Tax=Coccidioides immitis RMSCC 2394 TaxID=404692 RepID=A0A0J6Y9R7_COCIT|nr:meiosis-specific topoisomerase Spo11 [Coccidioides immitis RMSCC 2394]